MKKIRVAIVGCGIVAPAHAESYKRLEGVELACACDLDASRAKAFAEKFGFSSHCTDVNQVFADASIDAVSLCTGHATHAALAVSALEHGKHLLCEKPLCSNREGMDRMVAAHERFPNLAFGGVFQHRFDSSIRYVKKLMDEGSFGTVLACGAHIRCRRGPEYYRGSDWRGTWAGEGGSVTINQAIHSIDSLVWIMGGVQAVCGAFANHQLAGVIETEDTAVAALRFGCGALGTIESTSSSNIVWENTLFFHGTEGALEMREGHGIKVSFLTPEKTAAVKAGLAESHDPQLINAGKRYYGKSHPAQIADFIAAIREGRQPLVSPVSARHTVDVVLAIYQSQREGRWIDVSKTGAAAFPEQAISATAGAGRS